MTRPLISVLMLSYNHESYIEKSINSVVKQKNNDVGIEIILIDDGSTDATINILENIKERIKIPFKLIKKKHQGVNVIAKNFNELISHSNGDYLAFLSCDDEFIDDRFDEQLKILQTSDSVQIVYGNGFNRIDGELVGMTNSDKTNIAMYSNQPKIVYSHLTKEVPVLFIQSVLSKAEFLKGFQPFDEELIADDWVFNINIFSELIKNNWEYRFINKPYFFRNIHKRNTSRDSKVHFLRINQVLNKYFQESDKRNIQLNLTKKYAKQSFRKFDMFSALKWLFEHYKLSKV